MNKLYRSRDSKVISGVAGGIAEYFDIDPIIVRAVFIIATFGWGFSIIAYIILWIIVPYKPYNSFREVNQPNEINEVIDSIPVENVKKSNNNKIILGSILIIIGFLGLLNNVFPEFEFKLIFPVLLIFGGILILFRLPFSSQKSAEVQK